MKSPTKSPIIAAGVLATVFTAGCTPDKQSNQPDPLKAVIEVVTEVKACFSEFMNGIEVEATGVILNTGGKTPKVTLVIGNESVVANFSSDAEMIRFAINKIIYDADATAIVNDVVLSVDIDGDRGKKPPKVFNFHKDVMLRPNSKPLEHCY